METYVVRVWVPASAGDAGADQGVAPELRGEVEHPRSGLCHLFTTLGDLAAVLRGEPPA